MAREGVVLHDPPLDCETPAGPGLCLAWYDYGALASQQWMVCLKNGRGVIFFPHQFVRLAKNYSLGLSEEMTPFPPLPAYLKRRLTLATTQDEPNG